MEIMEFDEAKAYIGADYEVNEYIKIKQPSVKEIIDFGEKEYYSMVYTITATPADMMSELDDIGVNFMEVDEFDLFRKLAVGMTQDRTSILFGDLDFSKMKTYLDNESKEFVLADVDNGIIIDKLAYYKISNYLRFIHGFKANRDRAANNTTRRIMIQIDREKKNKAKKEGYKSTLKQLISAMMRYPGFKYKTRELNECGIYEFMDTVKGSQIYTSSIALLQGSYSGMIDTSKIKKENFNWQRNTNCF